MSNSFKILEIRHYSHLTNKNEYYTIDLNKANLPLSCNFIDKVKSYVVKFSYQNNDKDNTNIGFGLAFSSQLDAIECYDVMFNLIIETASLNDEEKMQKLIVIKNTPKQMIRKYDTASFRAINGK